MWIIYHIFKKNARIYPHRTKAELLQLTMWVKEKGAVLYQQPPTYYSRCQNRQLKLILPFFVKLYPANTRQ